MIFLPTRLPGALVIELERREDERGFFARTWCQQEFSAHGLSTRLAQCNLSSNRRRGTLRGMHFQQPPYAEVKLVRCTRGVVYDVMLDLRRASPTFTQWEAVELSAETGRMVYLPEGFAHGFQTLTDDSEVFYQISEFYHPEAAGGVRWDDPAFAIKWPLPDPILSDRDRNYPDFKAEVCESS
jgi:dTDP-4-dehydrorhamnose 3,5-epimerase